MADKLKGSLHDSSVMSEEEKEKKKQQQRWPIWARHATKDERTPMWQKKICNTSINDCIKLEYILS